MKEELEEVIKSLLDERLELQPVVPETRTERGYFRDFVVTCIYELVRECEVYTQKNILDHCSIDTVSTKYELCIISNLSSVLSVILML